MRVLSKFFFFFMRILGKYIKKYLVKRYHILINVTLLFPMTKMSLSISYIYIVPSKKKLFLQENKEEIFIKIMLKIQGQI